MQSFGTLVPALLLAGLITACAPEPKRLTVEPGPVTKTSGGLLRSYFVLREPKNDKESSRMSLGTAGACLIGDFNSFGYPRRDRHEGPDDRLCNADGDCQGGWPDAGWEGYCVGYQCMARPSPRNEFCTDASEHNGGNPWPLGRQNIPFAAKQTTLKGAIHGIDVSHVYAISQGKPIRWFVRGCLNEYDPDKLRDSTGCADKNDSERMLRDGPASYIP